MTSPDLSQRSDSATPSARDRGARGPLPLVVDLPPLRPGDVARVAAALGTSDERAGGHPVTAVILREAPVGSRDAVDPSVAAGVLAHAGVGIVVEASTSRHAPYNLARRIQSLARLTGGRAALLLHADGIDPVTLAGRSLDGIDSPGSRTPRAPAVHDRGDYSTSTGTGTGRGAQGIEYLAVLRALWRSFPEDALVGDAVSGVLADTARLAPPRFSGEAYAVEGVLNVPLAPRQTSLVIGEGADAPDADIALIPSRSPGSDGADAEGLPGPGDSARWEALPADIPLIDAVQALAARRGADAAVLRVPAGSDPAAALSDPVLADAVRTGLVTPRAIHGTLDDLTNTRKAVTA